MKHDLSAPLSLIFERISRAELARRLFITKQAVGKWRQVPAYQVLAVERQTGISRHVLRPDLYPEER